MAKRMLQINTLARRIFHFDFELALYTTHKQGQRAWQN
jgi:hypothetical protein